MLNTFDEIRQRLCEKDYKLTPQRQLILETFINSKNRHLSAEDVYQIVKKDNPDVGMATVYRTVDLLAELDILQKINFGDKCSRYELNQKNEHHHHHLICLKCGQVIEFEDDLLETLESQIQKKSSFKITDHQVKFYGYCEKCK